MTEHPADCTCLPIDDAIRSALEGRHIPPCATHFDELAQRRETRTTTPLNASAQHWAAVIGLPANTTYDGPDAA